MENSIAIKINTYLGHQQWKKISESEFGTLWQKREAMVGIPCKLQQSSSEFEGILQRIAYGEKMAVSKLQVALSLPTSTYDEIRFRAISTDKSGATISLDEAQALITMATKSLKAISVTSNKKKADIQGAYPKNAKEALADIRVGQTEHGSYILPIYIELVAPELDNTEELQLLQQSETGTAYLEPKNRKIARTLNSAFSILNDSVKKATEPNSSELTDMVYAGVSTQLIGSTVNFLTTPEHPDIDISFKWSEGYTAPKNSTAISFEGSSDVVAFLNHTRQALREWKKPSTATISGTLAGMMFPQNSESGNIFIQCEYNNRSSLIGVKVDADKRDTALRWMEDNITVVARGKVESRSGLRIDNPSELHAVGQFIY